MAEPIKAAAIILAGGSASKEIADATGVQNRALIHLGDRPMLDYVVAALVDSQAIDRIVVVGNLPADSRYELVPDGGDFVANLFGGIAAVGDADYALVCTADIPFITGKHIQEFVSAALALDANAVYPVVQVAECYARFPGVKRTALKLKEGKLTGGNVMLVRPKFLLSQKGRVQAAYEARKQPWKLALMLGLGTLIRVVLAQKVSQNLVDVPRLERVASRLLGGKARALVSSCAELATDLDRLSDITPYLNGLPIRNT